MQLFHINTSFFDSVNTTLIHSAKYLSPKRLFRNHETALTWITHSRERWRADYSLGEVNVTALGPTCEDEATPREHNLGIPSATPRRAVRQLQAGGEGKGAVIRLQTTMEYFSVSAEEAAAPPR